MRWNHISLLSGLKNLMGTGVRQSPAGRETRLEQIRLAMLRCVQDGMGDIADSLVHRLRFAADVESLWYLRADLMAALAEARGESFARQSISRLTPLFDGLIPRPLLMAAKSGR